MLCLKQHSTEQDANPHLLTLKGFGFGPMMVMVIIIFAAPEICEISLKYFAYSLKSIQPIADIATRS